MHEPSLSHNRPRFGCRLGTFSPSCLQIRSTRLWFTSQPSMRSRFVICRYPYLPNRLANRITSVRSASSSPGSFFTRAEAGINVTRASVMHLNRDFRSPDLGDRFSETDVTTEAAEFALGAATRIDAQLEMLDGPIPSVAIREPSGS